MPSLRSIFPCLNKKDKANEADQAPTTAEQSAAPENNVAFQNNEKEELPAEAEESEHIHDDVETPGNKIYSLYEF